VGDQIIAALESIQTDGTFAAFVAQAVSDLAVAANVDPATVTAAVDYESAAFVGSNPRAPTSTKGLSDGAIAGIVVGTVVGTLLVTLVVMAALGFFKRKETVAPGDAAPASHEATHSTAQTNAVKVSVANNGEVAVQPVMI
jgi:hypothetical protein